MLVVDITKRITMEEIVAHHWISLNYHVYEDFEESLNATKKKMLNSESDELSVRNDILFTEEKVKS